MEGVPRSVVPFRSGALPCALLALLCMLAGAVTAQAAPSAGKLSFAKPAPTSFEAYIRAPSTTQQAWLREHYGRMRTYAPYFDSRLSWYPNAWSYQDAYAIYPGKEAGLEQYILRDANGNRLYLPFQCANGTCPQYAGDVGDPGWRRHYIDIAKRRAAQGYKGMFVDDVNFERMVSDGNERLVAPIDERTGRPMTTADWQRYMAEFMEQLAAEVPAGFEIVHNQVWFFAGGISNEYVRRGIAAASHINIERGVIDRGLVGGSGPFGYETLMAYADYVHSRGKGVIWDAWGTWGREYAMASHFLVSTAEDFFHHPESSNPDNWWTGYDVNLGEPLGRRYAWNGVLRRDFERGIVLVNQPAQTTKSLALGGDFTTLGGQTVSSVSLAGADGAVLQRPEPRPQGGDKAAGRPATASSSYAPDFSAEKANDASSATRWSSSFGDNQWWQVDLGSVRKVDAVEINWEWAYARRYKILTSTDGTNFTERADVTISAPGLQRTTLATADARYVRVLGVTRATPWGFSFWDAKVFGPSDT